MKERFICAGKLMVTVAMQSCYIQTDSRQEHMCKEKCQSIGVCEIDTVPHSIQETFNGVHDQFQYTKVSL